MSSLRRLRIDRDNSKDHHETEQDREIGEAFDVLEECLNTIPDHYGAFRKLYRVYVCTNNLEQKIKEINKRYPEKEKKIF